MKFKLLNLMIMGLCSVTALANETIDNVPTTVIVPNQSVSTTFTEIQPQEIKPIPLEKERLANETINPTSTTIIVPNQSSSEPIAPSTIMPQEIQFKEEVQTDDLPDKFIKTDYLHSYDAPTYTQEDYERARKFLESEREKNRIIYPVYFPIPYR